MEADALVPPQTLPVQPIEAQGVGQQEQQDGDGEGAAGELHGATTFNVQGRMRLSASLPSSSRRRPSSAV